MQCCGHQTCIVGKEDGACAHNVPALLAEPVVDLSQVGDDVAANDLALLVLVLAEE